MPDHSRLDTDAQLRAHLKELKAAETAQKTEKQGENSGGVFRLNDQYRPMEYDFQAIETFLTTVFHTELIENEEILTYHDYGRHNLAISPEALLRLLSRSRKPARLYYGCSTCKRDQEGSLRNRKDLFSRYHVLVLDDIGTKVPESKITLDPTYVLESSPGNFQYGYVLKEPLTDLDEAQCLVDLVYGAGLSDEGGKLATKKVRLPGGVNGKRGPNFGFVATLHYCDPVYFTPQEILDGLGIIGIWETISADTKKARRTMRAAGTSHWSPTPVALQSNAGVIDTVAEWLSEQSLIRNISGEWLEIQCPWCDEHTDPSQDSAFYSPVGWGGTEYINQRTFYCHHSHPENTLDFLQWVSEQGGPEAPIHDPAADLVSRCVYDIGNDTCWDIKTSKAPFRYASFSAFKIAHCKRLLIKAHNPSNGKPRYLSPGEWDLWCQHPARVIVNGSVFDPSTNARVVSHEGQLKVNQCCRPDYGCGAYEQEPVDRFLAYLQYLIPDAEEYNIFLDWITAKFQSLAFRGWGMLMIAPNQRTGRGTLIEMLTALFYPTNCVQVPVQTLISESEFNEWEQNPLVFVGETEALSLHGSRFYSAYNRLKDVVDTTPRNVVINPKYGRKYMTPVYTSFLLCANESAALTLDQTDRRFYVISNPPHPAPLAYFKQTREWMADCDDCGQPKWCKHVARYLLGRKVDLGYLQGPAPTTSAKRDMLTSARTPLDVAMEAFFDALPSAFFPAGLIEDVLVHGGMTHRLQLDSQNASAIIRTQSRKHTLASKNALRVGNQLKRIRFHIEALNDPVVQRIKAGTPTASDRDVVRDQIEKIDLKYIKQEILSALSREGF